MTDCHFLGNGSHEIVVFTFNRHERLSRLSGNSVTSLWLAAGPHWSDRWHDAGGAPYADLPLIGLVRGISDSAGFIEPLRVRAVISCANAQFVYDEVLRRLAQNSDATVSVQQLPNPRIRRVDIELKSLLNLATEALTIPCPPIEPVECDNADCVTAISLGEIQRINEYWESFSYPGCTTWGEGSQLVYAYTFETFLKIARLAGEKDFPVKVGCTQNYFEGSPAAAAMSRIISQTSFPEPIQLLGLLRCANGRNCERGIHALLAHLRIKSPAREWFYTNSHEVCKIMKELLS